MFRMMSFIMMLLFVVPSAFAKDFLNWLEGAGGSYHHDKVAMALNGVELITLENGESEMYPKVSPDGKYFLVVSSKKHQPLITRRLLENGDPINVVSEFDPQVMASIAWHGNDNVLFLSHRADSLGLWKKPVDGGVTRRVYGRMDGELRTPIILEDGSLIAVRLHRSSRRMASERKVAKKNKVVFDNWQLHGKQPHLVRISKDGVESELASGVNPALSPDGQRLVFSMQAGRSWHLFMMNVDGSELVQLTEGRSIDVQPTWSPDGRWVAFTSNRGHADMRHKKSNWDVWMINYDGRDLMRLTMDKAKDGAPNFAKNGRLYFHSDRQISKEDRADHQVRGATKGFHVWSVSLPAITD